MILQYESFLPASLVDRLLRHIQEAQATKRGGNHSIWNIQGEREVMAEVEQLVHKKTGLKLEYAEPVELLVVDGPIAAGPHSLCTQETRNGPIFTLLIFLNDVPGAWQAWPRSMHAHVHACACAFFSFVHLCVCVVHACIYAGTYIRMYVYMHVCMHACVYVCCM